mgnify:CR=1 FL=1
MTAEETYLAWMRYALWGGDMPEAVDPAAIGEMIRVAARQKTRGLIFDALIRGGAPLSEDSVERMRQFLLQSLSTHRMLDDALGRAMTALREAGIPAVLLKGQGAARNYPNPQLRECGDIDIYIGPERLAEAVRTLSPLADRVDDHLNGKHWELTMGPAEIELHQHTMLPESRRAARFYPAIEEEGLTRGLVALEFNGVRVNTPEPTFNAFYLFYHAWHHFISGGVGFRQLCDWTLYLHGCRAQIDRDRLDAMLDGMRLRRPWQLFGNSAVQALGLPREEMPFYEGKRPHTTHRILRLILAEGNFGRGREPRFLRPKGYVAGKAYSFGVHFTRFCRRLPIAPREAWQNFVSLSVIGFRQVAKDLSRK